MNVGPDYPLCRLGFPDRVRTEEARVDSPVEARAFLSSPVIQSAVLLQSGGGAYYQRDTWDVISRYIKMMPLDLRESNPAVNALFSTVKQEGVTVPNFLLSPVWQEKEIENTEQLICASLHSKHKLLKRTIAKIFAGVFLGVTSTVTSLHLGASMEGAKMLGSLVFLMGVMYAARSYQIGIKESGQNRKYLLLPRLECQQHLQRQMKIIEHVEEALEFCNTEPRPLVLYLSARTDDVSQKALCSLERHIAYFRGLEVHAVPVM